MVPKGPVSSAEQGLRLPCSVLPAQCWPWAGTQWALSHYWASEWMCLVSLAVSAHISSTPRVRPRSPSFQHCSWEQGLGKVPWGPQGSAWSSPAGSAEEGEADVLVVTGKCPPC